MKFKAGDKVRVRKDLDYNKRYRMEGSNYSSRPAYVMSRWFAGEDMTIEDATDIGYYTVETGNTFLWTDEMLEEALPNIDISIFRSGRAVYAEDSISGKVRKAVCSEEDEFDPGYGAMLALSRLFGIKFELKGEADGN